jgi:putative transposase
MYSVKLELKLNNKERSRLAGCAGFARFVYNFGLALLTQSWAWTDVKVGDSKRLGAIEKVFTNYVKTKPEYAWMNEYPSAIYSQAFRHLRDAIKRWRSGLSGFPQFKRKRDRDSFTVLKKSGVYPESGQPMIPFTNRQILHPGKRITIPGLGEFRLKRPIPQLGSSQTFTVSRKADKWFVSFTVDAQKVPPTHHEVASVGIDLGVKMFATLSDNSTLTAPPSLKLAKTKLAHEQWRNRKRQHGDRRSGIPTSRNAKKFYARVARRHARIANIRNDFLQKVTTDISRKYYRIRIEDLNVSGMMANSKLSDAIGNLGFYEFRRQLTYKQDFYGTVVELVDRWYSSSKTCSDCGHVQQMRLRDRVFSCQGCGVVKCRDFNASLNLENAPQERVRRATAELTPVDWKVPSPQVEAGSKR